MQRRSRDMSMSNLALYINEETVDYTTSDTGKTKAESPGEYNSIPHTKVNLQWMKDANMKTNTNKKKP